MVEPLPLIGKTVVLGIGGSVAAYKGADVCSKLKQAGADVHPILTPGAEKFIGASTLSALAHRPVSVGVWDEVFGHEHIAHLHYGDIADLFLVAPASAGVLSRVAAGDTSDMLGAALLANPGKPVLIAPAMNTHMWNHPASQRNVKTLQGWGHDFIDPEVGRLAEGYVGAGRLANTDQILARVRHVLSPVRNLAGVTVLITAGPTREALDPVRFLSNRSSGKMGYAVAEAATRRGATVTLVSGPTHLPDPPGVETIRVTSAQEMANAVYARAAQMQVVIASAAVADYTPETVAPQKIKKTGEDVFLLRLRPTQDILATLGARKPAGQILVGFAAETEATLDHARGKLITKNLDLIVANDVTLAGAGFDTDTNIVSLLLPHGETIALPLQSKRDVAERICDQVAALVAKQAS